MIRFNNSGLKGMTYILGSVCSDGVVLVSDRKITLDSGAAHEYENKLFSDIQWMVVGSSGTFGLFEKFRDKLSAYLVTPAYKRDIIALTTQIENITRELNTSYREVLGGQVFDVLLGIKPTAGAILRYIHPRGFAEGVRRYKVIGHGEPYGSFFLKRWWRENMKMLDVAELGFFIIKYIEEFELDNTVDIGNGRPQVWFIPNKPPPKGATSEQRQSLYPYQLSADSIGEMEDGVSKKIKEFKKLSWGN